MIQIPETILYQVHVLASEGEWVDHIAILLRMSKEAVEAELKNPTVEVHTTKPSENDRRG
jgi:hypothetical protein